MLPWTDPTAGAKCEQELSVAVVAGVGLSFPVFWMKLLWIAYEFMIRPVSSAIS